LTIYYSITSKLRYTRGSSISLYTKPKQHTYLKELTTQTP